MEIIGNMKLDITIAVPGLQFSGSTFDKLSIGGSESAGYYLARALSALGHRVTVFCNTSKFERCADVDYMPLSMFRQYTEFTVHDVCIVQREPQLFSIHCRARLSILWCHDLALRRSDQSVKGAAWNYDKVAVLSEFMRDQYKEVYALPDEMMFLTRNGVDLSTVAKVREKLAVDQKVKRNPLALVCSARPERGADVLLGEIMPRILKHEPNARLFLSTYNNPVEHLADFYAHCKQLSNQLGRNVTYLGHLTKEQLYEAYLLAGLYLYPTPSKLVPEFDEISCISVMETQACGLPTVTSARGALPETIAPGAGVLVAEKVHTPAYYDAFAEAALRLMRDPEAWRAASAAGLARSETLDWSGVARQWTEMFLAEIQHNNSDLATLANHFWRHSDIYAAKECLRRLPADDTKSATVRRRIAEDWAFLDEPEGFRKQYERIGGTHNPEVINWSNKEPRYDVLKQWLQKRLPQAANESTLSVLDYGCAHGGYAVNLLKELGPGLRITGVDIDLHGIEMACGFAEKLGVADRFRGVVGDLDRLTDPNVPEMVEQYDVALIQEVLEHVPNPGATLAALEQRVRDGGTVYITVPIGPWEYSDYRRTWGAEPKGYPYRAHVREFDIHDLHELLDVKGEEANVTKEVMPYGHSPETDDPLGWWVISYKVTPETRGKVGAINLDRKLAIQRPRQTLSVAIMAGGPKTEETLHWCLRSLEHVADEVVVVDCGLSEEARRILSLYDSRLKVISDGPDPKTAGFETPRNLSLEHCTQDWVLWLDTDESLLNQHCLGKYLRRNIYQGYSLYQHHFAVDTHFDADLPVRLFRNNGKLHFFGMIHEHPETAINEGPGRTIVISDVHIPHMGYLIEHGRRTKFDRNLPMLEADIAKYPQRKLQKHFIMRDKMLLISQAVQQTGRLDDGLVEECRAVQKLWRDNFRGQGFMSNTDPITYYSQATKLLGEGFDTAFQVAADKVEAKLNGALSVRFANLEDFEVEIAYRARQVAQPYTARYW